LTFHIFRN